MSEKVTRLSQKSRSLSDLSSNMTRVCHHCHAPQSDPSHAGIRTGPGHCTLDHWESCTLQLEAGYDKHKQYWTGCVGVEIDSTEGEGSPRRDTDRQIDKTELEESLKSPGLAASFKESLDDDVVEDTEDEEDRLALEELALLKKKVELEEQDQQIEEDRVLALKEAKKAQRQALRLKIEQQREELLIREKAQQQRKAEVSSVRLTKSAPRTAPEIELNKQKLQAKTEAHAARQRKAAAEKSKLDQTSAMTIAGIRQLPGMTQQVEDYLASLQSNIPAIARDPTAANSSGRQFQPTGVHQSAGPAPGLTVAPGYVFVEELGQLVPVVPKLSIAACPDSEVSADDECPVSPSPGNRLVWKRDSSGVKYCEETPLREKSPEIVATWVKRADGRIYKELKGTSTSARVKSKAVPTFVDHRQPALKTRQNQAAEQSQPKDDRQPTFISSEERSGKETGVPLLVKRARSCPVSWTDKITSDQMNPIVWSWAYIAELLAARSGQAPDLDTGELEARLQHFLNVMEVTLQTSTKTDYMGDSWKVARLYNTKIQAKLDQGATTWCKMVERWDSSTLPHELMAAQQELAPRQVRGKGRDQDTKQGEAPIRCGTWNTWETKGKCRYESENQGQKCNRLHECTYCKTKKFKPVTHQRLFCEKRIAAGSD